MSFNRLSARDHDSVAGYQILSEFRFEVFARFQLAGVEPVIEADQKARALRDRVRRSLGSDGRILRKKRERGQRQQNTPQAPEAGHSGPQSRDLNVL